VPRNPESIPDRDKYHDMPEIGPSHGQQRRLDSDVTETYRQDMQASESNSIKLR